MNEKAASNEMHPKSWTGKEKPVKLKRGVF